MTRFKNKAQLLAGLVVSLCMCAPLFADSNPQMMTRQPTSLSKPASNSEPNFEQIKNEIWKKYVNDVQQLTELKSQYDNRALNYQDKTMRFSLEKIGEAPADGYPLYIALHGGGQGGPHMNDSQWEHMKIYYRDSVKNGIYVATRGITDNWNLHFEKESYPLYEKLIESAILFDNVNPNRVYFMGFSAGGDGVYQVVPRMPDRFAAANMSAGHHNWIHFDNLYNTPFLMQVGEFDSAYDRDKIAVQNYITMNELHTKYGDGYLHNLFMHYNGSHNSWHDNDPSYGVQPIIADPVRWLQYRDRTTKSVNTNAIAWMDAHTRQPLPQKLVWDLSTSATSREYQTGAALSGKNEYPVKNLAKPYTLFYWLDVSVADNWPENGKLVVEADKSSNTIRVMETANIDKFRILLNPWLLNLSQPVHVEINNQLIGSVKVSERKDIMIRTMLERSDSNEIYNGQIILAYNKKTNKWEITPILF